MLEKVEKFLREYDLLDKSYLVAFSGGADSLCLLDLLNIVAKKYDIKIYAMHLNHNWRGIEALEEMKNCENYCRKNNIPIFTKTLDENLKHTELVAREERHKFFIECCQKVGNPVVFTGHTASDNAETLLYRIVKGTGVSGLRGISPEQKISDVKFYRPLLNFSRQDTEIYCKKNNLNYNSDSSNSDVTYKRNFIRLEVMPKLEQINENVQASINMLSDVAKSEMQIIDEYLNTIKKDVLLEDKYLTQNFVKLSKPVQYHLIYDEFILKDLDYDNTKISNVIEFINKNSKCKSGSRLSVTNDLWLFVNTKEFCFINSLKEEVEGLPIKVNDVGKYNFSDYEFEIKEYSEPVEKYPSETDTYAYVDLSDFKIQDLEIRTRTDGDYIVPFGMQGSMKLKKYFNLKKIPQHKKDGIILLCKGAEVLWASSVGLSNKLRVDKIPTHVLKLKNSIGA